MRPSLFSIAMGNMPNEAKIKTRMEETKTKRKSLVEWIFCVQVTPEGVGGEAK